MTGIRQSIVFAKETTFAGGNSGTTWIAPPPGSYFSSTATRNVQRIQSTGSKKRDTVAYGKFSGTWEWSFTMDYQYLEPLALAFEGYEYTGGEHVFKKDNSKRVPSFCVRRKILNNIAGGPANSDETVILKGCVCKSIKFSQSAGNSQMQVSMSGFYVDEEMTLGSLTATDFQTYTSSDGLTEFACMFVDSIADTNYVGNTESLGFDIDNGATPLDNTCTPISTAFTEGLTNYSFNTSCYSNDPSKYKQRLYSGGQTLTTKATKPRCKGLKPISKVYIVSFNKCMRDDNGTSISSEITGSSKYMKVEITNCVVKSLTWSKGDGSKLMDQISSAECEDIQIKIKCSSTASVLTSPHKTVSVSTSSTTT